MASNTHTSGDTLDVSIAIGLIVGAAVGYFLIGSWAIGLVAGIFIGSFVGLVRAAE